MEPVDRRSFLRGSLGVAAGVVAGGACLESPAQSAEADLPQPCPPGAWRKHGVVLAPTEPWEGDHIQNFTCPCEPLDRNKWRLWYSVCGSTKAYTIAYAEGEPGGPMKKHPVERRSGRPGDGAFALGHLPDTWNPVQVVHLPLANGKHRIYFWVHGPGIARYLAADSEDGHRFQVIDPRRPVLYHPHDRAACGVPSPDGLVLHKAPSKDRPADEPLAASHLISNDATNVYQLPDGSFELYSVGLVQVPKDDPAYVGEDNAPGLLRVVDRYASEDGLRFEKRTRIIQRDALDPADQQFYYLAVTRTPKGRVGMLGHYRVRAQTMDLEWCFSADGLKWARPRRTPWLPRGDRSQPDSYGIYASSSIVPHQGRHHLFYTGVNSAHNEKDSHGKPRTVVMLATTESLWR
ncbi:MAG TPA: twin-arginine translocation signal domain-containing protein [Phycisphaerae bacterium]|nr:twin-arginine translocation signal domain-containing protein [Phycisphaerae bacterium]HRY67669.1 twin-arginine translocation signal domain-containing protein [Phycisphaerae bacterium]HSA25056.1 twin-arginine translocation signal domain-containing protein [Phycisphaerae bacterium]